jgi:hypothetical protein
MNFRTIFAEALEEAFDDYYTKPTVSKLIDRAGKNDNVSISLGTYPSAFGPYGNGLKATIKVFMNYNPLDPENYAEEIVYYTGNIPIAAKDSPYHTVKTETIAASNELKRVFQDKGAVVYNYVPESVKEREALN